MKRTIKTKTIETTVWTSVDGKEFLNEEECRAYEKEFNKTLEACWRKIPKSSVCASNFLWGGCDYDTFYLIRPRTFDEISVINMYCAFFGSDLLTQEDVGNVVTLNEYDCNWYRLENGIEGCIINPIQKAIEVMKTGLDNWGKADEKEGGISQ